MITMREDETTRDEMKRVKVQIYHAENRQPTIDCQWSLDGMNPGRREAMGTGVELGAEPSRAKRRAEPSVQSRSVIEWRGGRMRDCEREREREAHARDDPQLPSPPPPPPPPASVGPDNTPPSADRGSRSGGLTSGSPQTLTSGNPDGPP